MAQFSYRKDTEIIPNTEIKREILEASAEIKREILEVIAEIKCEIPEVKAEIKSEILEFRMVLDMCRSLANGPTVRRA